MGELGQLAVSEHTHLGRKIAEIHPRLVLWTGGYGAELKAGLQAGRSTCEFLSIETPDDFLKALERLPEDELQKGGVILFKGSRVNRLERMVEAFTASRTGAPNAL